MVTRRAGLVVLSAVAAACARRAGPSRELAPGMAAPTLLTAGAPRQAVRAIWVFEGGDLLNCRSSARELRHIQARFGDSVSVAAVAIDADPGYVRSFLRVQRVNVPVAYADRSRDSRRIEGLLAPALYLTDASRIVAILPGVPMDDPVSIHTRNIDARIDSLLALHRAGTSYSPQNGAEP